MEKFVKNLQLLVLILILKTWLGDRKGGFN